MKATKQCGFLNHRTTKQQDILREITNLMFLTLHLSLLQDQKVKTEKIMNFSFVVAGEKNGKKRCNGLLHTFERSVKSLISETSCLKQILGPLSPAILLKPLLLQKPLASFLLIFFPLRFFGQTQILQPTMRKLSSLSSFYTQAPPLVTGSRI